MKLLATAPVVFESLVEENNGYVVFKCNIHKLYQLGNRVVVSGGGVTPPNPTLFYNRLLDRYLKTT
jgi:hypothetical protein